MSTITGKRREYTGSADFVKRVGLFEAKVIAINPTADQYKELLGFDLKEDSKECEYLGTSEGGNTTFRVTVWLEDVKTSNREQPDRYKLVFFLENKERENKEMTKKQYINNVGSCSWASDVNNLPEWILNRDYRVAYQGEEEFYSFLRAWLSALDYKHAETVLDIEWKKLMKGNVNDIREHINGELCTDKDGNVIPFGALATVNVKEKDGEIKEYQTVYNKDFLPKYAMKNFRLIDYSNPKVIEAIKAKKPKDQKPHEKFVLGVIGEYGCKDSYILKDIRDYDPNDFLTGGDKVISEEGSDY